MLTNKNAIVTEFNLEVSGIIFKDVQKCLEDWLNKNKLKGISVIWIDGRMQFVITDDCNLGNPIDTLRNLTEGILLGWDLAEDINRREKYA